MARAIEQRARTIWSIPPETHPKARLDIRIVQQGGARADGKWTARTRWPQPLGDSVGVLDAIVRELTRAACLSLKYRFVDEALEALIGDQRRRTPRRGARRGGVVAHARLLRRVVLADPSSAFFFWQV